MITGRISPNLNPQVNLSESNSNKYPFSIIFTELKTNIEFVNDEAEFKSQKNIVLNAIEILQKEQNIQANYNTIYFEAANVSIDNIEEDSEAINQVKTYIQEILGENISSTVLDQLKNSISELTYQLHIYNNKQYQRQFTNKAGDKYKGFLVNGKFHGIGKLIKANGDIFIGEFKNWEFYKGILTYSDGEEYDGEFENGEFVIGTYTWLDDEKNIHKLTKLTRDKIIKNAIYTWAQGDKTYTYEGEFKNKKLDGKGILTYPDGAVYEGDFLDGRRHGYSIYTNVDGSRYEGNYINGQREGSGTLFDKKGKQTFTVVFKNGELV